MTLDKNPHGRYLAMLSTAALGVVYGDIGTSPLYALHETFSGPLGIAPTPENVLGVLSLVFWSLPIAIIALVTCLFAPRAGESHAALPQRWLPDWHTGLVWRLGALFCCINAIYFSANAFIPIYLASAGRPDLISSALTALNFGQIPASLALLVVAQKLERRAWPYIASGLLSLLSIAGLVSMVGTATVVWAALLGFSDAAALIVGLTLPPLLCRHEDVARTSAGMFTISYAGGVAIAIVSGAAWDLSGIPAFAFVPLGACAIGLAAVSLSLRAKRELL